MARVIKNGEDDGWKFKKSKAYCFYEVMSKLDGNEGFEYYHDIC